MSSKEAEEATSMIQALTLQQQFMTLLTDSYVWSFKTCTTSSSGPYLSAKEKRCIQQGVANYVEARTFISQSTAAANAANK